MRSIVDLSSTALPQNNNPQEIQKGNLDLLNKLKDVYSAARADTGELKGQLDSLGGTTYPDSDANRSATLVVNTSTNTAGVWSAAYTMTGVPSGAKAAWCLCSIYKSGAVPLLAVEAATGYTLSDISSGNNIRKYWAIGKQGATGDRTFGVIKIHLDANGQFKWCTSISSSEVIIGSAIDYEM